MFTSYWPHIMLALDFAVRLILGYRIIQRRLAPGVAWAWLSLLIFVPLMGTFLYLFLGEYRLGRRRERRIEMAKQVIFKLVGAAPAKISPWESWAEGPARSMAAGAVSLFGTRPLAGNAIELLDGADKAFPRMIEDVDQAIESCDMEFYIWSDGGRSDDFAEALLRAVKRGVKVRVLVDRIGSLDFLKGPTARKLKDGGVDLREALPSGIVRSLVARPDLRIHRKILVIDRKIAYTGSLNLADPIYFKKDAGVGQWVDALCRIRGPAVRPLHLVFLSDWTVELGSTIETLADYPDLAPTNSSAVIQCLPSGPAIRSAPIEELLIAAISSARRELVLTTPYFVPNEALLYALCGAARRGVAVTLIVPKKVDSRLTHYASRAFLKDLVDAGVNVALYAKGLLHTKSVVIDDEVTLFGSLNLDPRSLRINFEITVAVYDQAFASAVRQMQDRYRSDSEAYPVEAASAPQLFAENFARLIGPVL